MTETTPGVLGSLTGATALVTGGARGIGRAIALRLAETGSRVAVVDRDLEAAAKVGERLTADSVEAELRERSGDALTIEGDLTQPPVAVSAVDAVLERWGRLDVLVTAAGGAITDYRASRASELTDDDLRLLWDVNVRATVNCCRPAVSAMARAGAGSIVTIGSGTALGPREGGYLSGYGASKAAVLQYTRYLATEVGPYGVRVNCVAPGVIRTARVVTESAVSGIVSDAAAAAIPLRRQGEAADVATAVWFLASPLSGYITGQVLPVNGGAVMH